MFSTFRHIHYDLFLHCILAPFISICEITPDSGNHTHALQIFAVSCIYSNQELHESKPSYRGSQRHYVISVWHQELNDLTSLLDWNQILLYACRRRKDARKAKLATLNYCTNLFNCLLLRNVLWASRSHGEVSLLFHLKNGTS